MAVRRRYLRLPDYDYATAGYYFVTVVTHGRECWLSRIEDGKVILTEAGLLVNDVRSGVSERFPDIELDALVVMPNHVHAILAVGAQFIAPSESGRPGGAMNRAPTVGAVIRALKAASTRLIRQSGCEGFAWQSNY